LKNSFDLQGFHQVTMTNERGRQRREKILSLIRAHWERHGLSPTVRELADALGYRSPHAIQFHLQQLEQEGLIERSSGQSRSIRLVSASYGMQAPPLPLAGTVAAGGLTEAVENQETVDLTGLFPAAQHFLLRVQGDSMVEAHICDGDLVVVKSQPRAKRGDIVVVRTDQDEATLKYWYPEKKRIRLQPANSQMKAIYVNSATIVGIVVGVIRSLKS
jgi:repressor LexA